MSGIGPVSVLTSMCACGRLIVASASWDIPDSVRRHGSIAEHRAWRRRKALTEATSARRARLRRALNILRLERDLLRENGR